MTLKWQLLCHLSMHHPKIVDKKNVRNVKTQVENLVHSSCLDRFSFQSSAVNYFNTSSWTNDVIMRQMRSFSDKSFMSSATKAGRRLCLHQSVFLWAGYLKMLTMDSDEIWWTGWVCDEDKLTWFWWRTGSGYGFQKLLIFKTIFHHWNMDKNDMQ